MSPSGFERKMYPVTRLTLISALAALSLLTGIRLAMAQQMTVSESSFESPKSWFKPASCAARAGADLHVEVGKTILKIPLDVIRGIRPGKLQATADAAGKMEYRLDPKSGCREVPLSISVASISSEPDKHGPIVIGMSPENRAPLETQLSALRTSGSCLEFGAGLISCEVAATAGGAPKEIVMYMMASDPASVQASGGPLRAICRNPQRPLCTVIDDLPGEVRYETLLTSAPTLTVIMEAHKSSRSYVDSLRVGPR